MKLIIEDKEYELVKIQDDMYSIEGTGDSNFSYRYEVSGNRSFYKSIKINGLDYAAKLINQQNNESK